VMVFMHNTERGWRYANRLIPTAAFSSVLASQ
jgi:hypothetical protein